MAVQPALLFGALSALFSAITGYCLSLEGGYAQKTLSYHQYAGIVTTLFAFLLLYLRVNRSILDMERKRRKPVRFYLFLPLVLVLTLTGHWGGSLTHGEEFITALPFTSSENTVDPITKIQLISKPDEAILYQDVIQPILESKCYSCHSSAKQKGDLRLDKPQLILHGGKDGGVIHPGHADSSSLFTRMMLPLEHEDHMPPNEKPQPSSAELDLIRLWINEGAYFDKRIKDLRQADKAIQFVTLLAESIQDKTWLPKENASEPDESALQRLKDQGAIVLSVGQNTNYIHVNFTNTRNLSSKALEALKPLRDHIVSLRFSYCTFQEPDLAFLSDFDKLTWLFLDHTNVKDESFRSVKEFPGLKYLNVVFTEVSGEGVTRNRFPALEQLFVFESKVTKEQVTKIQLDIPAVKVDTGGISLPTLASDTIIYKKKS